MVDEEPRVSIHPVVVDVTPGSGDSEGSVQLSRKLLAVLATEQGVPFRPQDVGGNGGLSDEMDVTGASTGEAPPGCVQQLSGVRGPASNEVDGGFWCRHSQQLYGAAEGFFG